MKKTDYVVMTQYSVSNKCQYRRVYEENGVPYIRTKGGYKDISKLPCNTLRFWCPQSMKEVEA